MIRALILGALFQLTPPWALFTQTATSGAPDFTLPDANQLSGRVIMVKVVPGAAATLVRAPSANQPIDGATTYTVASGGDAAFQSENGVWRLTTTFDPAGGGGGAPSNAEFVTFAANASLSNERVLVAGVNTTVNTGTPGQIAIDVASSGGGDGVAVNVDFGTYSTVASTVVTGQTWVAAGSEIVCTPTAIATASRLEGAEDVVIEQLSAAIHTKVVGTGFTLTVSTGTRGSSGIFVYHCLGI